MRVSLAIAMLTLAGCTASVRPAKTPEHERGESCSAFCVLAWCTVNCPPPTKKEADDGGT